GVVVRIWVGRLLEGAPVAELGGHILSAARAILHRMGLDSDRITRLHGIGFPALGSDLTDRAHFKRPIDRAACSRVRHCHVQPAMRIRIFEFLQCSRDGDRLFMIKHREGMMSMSRNGESGYGKYDQASNFQIHDISPCTTALPHKCRLYFLARLHSYTMSHHTNIAEGGAPCAQSLV